MLLEYVPREVNDPTIQSLFERDAAIYGQPSLFARALAHNPTVLDARLEYVASLTGSGGLDDRLAELIYASVAQAKQCEYCIDSHTNRLVEGFDLDEETIEAIEDRDDETLAGDLSERESSVISFVTAMATDPKRVSDRDIDRLREHGFGDDGLIALVVTASAAIAATVIADTLNIHPQDAATLDDIER